MHLQAASDHVSRLRGCWKAHPWVRYICEAFHHIPPGVFIRRYAFCGEATERPVRIWGNGVITTGLTREPITAGCSLSWLFRSRPASPRQRSQVPPSEPRWP